MRIWEQVEADNIKYDGELEMGDAGNKGKVEAYPRLLVPILKIDQGLREVNSLVHENDRTSAWPKALAILQNGNYEKIAFKKIFNAYSDNIYYSDPDRANAYLGGGATPKNEQSIAYLLRNVGLIYYSSKWKQAWSHHLFLICSYFRRLVLFRMY